jgi:hypothetical protein
MFARFREQGGRLQATHAEPAGFREDPQRAHWFARIGGRRRLLERLRRGASVVGGLGRPLDIGAMLKATAFTASMLRRSRLLENLTEKEFKMLLERTRPSRTAAADKVTEREARRIIKARN